jgi:hypothetical protein
VPIHTIVFLMAKGGRFEVVPLAQTVWRLG